MRIGFYSILVRLKGLLANSYPNHNLFLFQTGSIKSVSVDPGAIRAGMGFYSILVRLKGRVSR